MDRGKFMSDTQYNYDYIDNAPANVIVVDQCTYCAKPVVAKKALRTSCELTGIHSVAHKRCHDLAIREIFEYEF